ncbi:hypothetical protein HWV62_36133 [Athelia sp. TMB]|nr:hypothetical protein HWV62_36133 [Athelia sp. TMB]
MTRGDSGFTTTVRVPYGAKVEYKFLVDGVWQTSPEAPTERDPSGKYLNNAYTAPPKPASKVYSAVAYVASGLGGAFSSWAGAGTEPVKVRSFFSRFMWRLAQWWFWFRQTPPPPTLTDAPPKTSSEKIATEAPPALEVAADLPVPVIPVKAAENDITATVAEPKTVVPETVAAPIPVPAAQETPAVAAIEAAVQPAATPSTNGISTHAPIAFTKSPSPLQTPPSPPADAAPAAAAPTANGDSTHTHAPISFSKGAKGGLSGAVASVTAIAAAVADPVSVISPPARSPSPDVNTHAPISFSKATGKARGAANDATAVDPVPPVPVAAASVTAPVEESTPAPVTAEVVPAPVEVAAVAPEVVAAAAAVPSPSVEQAAAAPLPTPAAAEEKALATNGDATKTEAAAPAAAAPGLPSPPTTPTRKSFGGDSLRRSPFSAVRGSLSKKSLSQEKDLAGEVASSPSKFSTHSSASLKKRHSIFGRKPSVGSAASTDGDGDSSKYDSLGKKKPSFITKVKRVLSDKHMSHLKDKE